VAPHSCLPACLPPHRDAPSPPTRRSSDLTRQRIADPRHATAVGDKRAAAQDRDREIPTVEQDVQGARSATRATARIELYVTEGRDRKSTRLNSSHVKISYAVFCLKKKKHN